MSRDVLWAFAFLMILAVTLSTLFVGTSNSGASIRAYNYENAPEIPPNARAILASLGTSLTPAQLSTLKNQFGSGNFQSLSGNRTARNPISVLLQTMTNASSKLAEINVVLHQARKSLAAGDMKSVEEDIHTLDALASVTQNLLGSSTRTLNEISATYNVDTTVQAGKVRQLYDELQGYLLSIDELKLKASERSIQGTLLSLNASLNQVYVEDSFSVGGVLRWEQTPLPDREITISWESANVSLTTNSTGGYQTDVLFPFGTPSGPTVIEAFYQPSGNDTLQYQAAYSAIQVTVTYILTQITAKLAEHTLRPQQGALITGNLTTSTGQPLVGQSLTAQVNGLTIANTTTVTDGAFFFILTVPQTMRNGTYSATINFDPTIGQYAASSSSLQIQVITIPTALHLVVDRGLAFSGTNVTLTGKITYANGTAVNRGTLLIHLDNTLSGNTTTIHNGTFQYSVRVSMFAGFGPHSVTVNYVPADAWADASQDSVSVYIVNTPFVLLSAAILIIASSGSFVWFRRHRITVVRQPQYATTTAVVMKRPRPVTPAVAQVEESLAVIHAETNSDQKVRKAYELAQTLIDAKLREEHPKSETAWEYYSRVRRPLLQITDALRRLTELFELADYSQFQINETQAYSALDALASIRDKLGT